MNLADLFRAEGIRVIEEGDWAHRMRSGGFTPVGIVNHHTGAKREASDGNVVKLLINGRSDLPGPLCTSAVMDAGPLHLISAGRANHAGAGYSGVLERVRKDLPPWGRERDLPKDDTVGNGWFYGFEYDHPGDASAYNPAGIDTLIRANTALCRFHRWSPYRCIHHAEWTDRKVDMSWRGDLRGLVAYRLEHAVLIDGVWQYPPNKPDPIPTPPPKDDDMPAKQVLIKSADRAHIFATDGLSRTHMKGWDDIRDLIRAGVVEGDGTLKTVVTVNRATIDALPLNGDEVPR